ncbi:cellulose binding domain-containing protein [Rhizomonospora bruguierae]|uniref:cellulose binding domain-containing protein n=1 Tax=Rhizomonospora bruguierae TaxID=1581705 RepID=UPI001BCEE05C|nr:cellulose binding domain-containing protein [Micromonospora sp. NBRC 107566]
MSGARSASSPRRLWPALLATFTLPAAMIAIGLAAVPGASAGSTPAPLPVAATVAPPPPTPPPTTPNTSPFPPSAPTNLVATSVRTTSVTLSWTASTPGCCAIEGYDITYTESFNDIAWSVRLGNVTTATITTGIRATGQYHFSVRARDGLGHQSLGTPISVVTPATDTGPDTTPPTAPANLAASGVTATSVVLTWSPATDNVGVVGYDVYRFDGLYLSTLLATVSSTTYPAALSSSAYRNIFYVRARDAAGNLSASSNMVPVETTNPTATPTVTPTLPPPTCRVTYHTQSEWTGGFVTSVTVANTGRTAIDGWTLAFSFPGDQRVTSYWSAAVTQSGTDVTARNLGWNNRIAPDGSVTFGIQGQWTASNAAPAGFSLNGLPCTIG